MKYIDRFLNSITMYKLILYSLQVLTAVSFILSFFHVLTFRILSLIASFLIITVVTYYTNLMFGKMYKVQTNIESSSITGIILFLVLAPPVSYAEAGFIALCSFLAIASKYVFAVRGRHIFNPVAISLVIIGLIGSGQASWWIGSAALLPFTLVAGFLIVTKTRRWPLFIAFFATAFLEIVLLGLYHNLALSSVAAEAFVSWPLIFFGTFMLTEPATMPYSQSLQIYFGIIVGLLFGSQWSVGPLFATPEFALCIGNIFAFIVSSRPKLRLKLIESKQIADNVREFSFSYFHQNGKPLAFLPGQYMEWTFAHPKPDSRGNRRYFTIASAPTEENIKFAMRIQPTGASSFKNSLSEMKPGEELLAGALAGNFVLPSEDSKNKKLAFIAGGIGITPFRSMIKYLLDIGEKRDIVLFYAANTPKDFAYQELCKEAEAIGLKTIYAVRDVEDSPKDWQGRVGIITASMFKNDVPDFLEREWYISGPNAMVETYSVILRSLNIPSSHIKKDYFPGF